MKLRSSPPSVGPVGFIFGYAQAPVFAGLLSTDILAFSNSVFLPLVWFYHSRFPFSELSGDTKIDWMGVTIECRTSL